MTIAKQENSPSLPLAPRLDKVSTLVLVVGKAISKGADLVGRGP